MEDLKLYTGDLISFRFKFKITKPRSWGNCLVGLFMKLRHGVNIQHSAVYSYILGQPLVFQSSIKKGVNFEHLDRFPPETEIIITRDTNSKGSVRRGVKHLGKKYDILTILLHLVFIMTNKWIKTPKQDDKHICSELAATIFKYDKPYKYDPVTLYKKSEDNEIYRGTVGELLAILKKK